MNPESAKRLCRRLMRKYGLIEKGWKFEWMKSRAYLGDCCSKSKVIRLSNDPVDLKDRDEVLDTILHEAAHALVGCRHGHSKKWKKKALELGCRPKSIA